MLQPVNMSKITASLTTLRLVLIPLVLICNIKPRYTAKWVQLGDIPFFCLAVFGGAGNGYLTTICQMHIPK